MIGCTSPVTEAVPAKEATPPAPTALQAVHHVLTPVNPVLTWRDNPSPSVPMALTASDGTGLDLVSVQARVIIEDPLAFTELRLVFDNPESRRREGRFEIELPPGAALSRLAMRIGSELQEGEVVERAKAQRTYETFMHRRPLVDPALLEHDTANRVQARVFPIAPRERKEIVVSFSQELDGGPYRLPLQGLSTIEDFDARITVKTHDDVKDRSSLSGSSSAQRVVEFQRTHFSPTKDLVVELDGAGAGAGVHAGSLAVVRVRPRADRPATPPASLLVLFDTSASATKGFEDRIERFGGALAQLASDHDVPVRVLGFDQEVRTVFEGNASALDVDALAELVEGRALGASDLEAALEVAAAGDGRWDRVLLVSDGAATAGATERHALRVAARKLEDRGVRRLDALAPGNRGDRERLADLTTALPDPGVVLDDQASADAIVQGLETAPFGDVAMTVDGATWSWPNTLAGVEPGGDVLVFAHYETTRPPAVRVQFSDSSIASHVVHTLAVEAPLVERAWARARIERIQHAQARLDDDTPAHRDMDERIVALSTHYRVLTDLTALLVLETDNDYRRFGIPRDGRADILTADGGSVRLRRRSKTPTKPLHVDEDLPLEEEQQPDTRAQRVSSATRHRGEEGTMGTARSASAWAVGEDDQDVWGGLTGTEVDEAFGLGGLGSTASASGVLGVMGAGRGGGGDGEGTIGLGNVGLIGKGGGSGSGSGYGMGSGAGFGGRGSHGLGSLPMDSMQMFADGPWANTNPMHGSRLPGEAMPPARRIDGLRRPRHVAVPRIRRGRPQVMGMLDADIIRRVVRHHANEVRYCYNQGLASNPTAGGRVEVAFTLDTSGTVTKSIVKESTLHDKNIGLCIAKATGRWRFPRPAAGLVHVVMPFELAPDTVAKRRSRSSPPRKRKRPATAPHTGRYAETRRLLDAGRDRDAYALASSWVRTQPEDTLGLLALGEALEHRGRTRLAARVYGSLIDLHPSRADIRRAAGQRLQALGKDGLPLAIDTFAKAVAARPDQPTGARLHAWALVEQGRHAEAFAVLREAFDRRYPRGRFARVHSVLHRDLSIVAAAWSAADPQAAKAGLAYTKVTTATVPSTRFVLSWETDTTDLDLTLHAPESRRRRQRRLADVTTGYGPEEYVVPGKTMPDRLQATVQYYDRGAMGHALGAVQLVRHDGHGGVTIESRPFVLMQQGSTANLGSFELGDPALARPS